MASFEWMTRLQDLAARGVPCVLVTLMDAKGSTPREAGTKMVVTMEEQFCTIGGGNLEFQAVAEARKLLAENATGPQAKHYPLGPKLAQCCGGAVTVLLEPFLDAAKTVWLFGAGHVGKEVAKVLDTLPVRVKWIDARENEFPGELPKNAVKIIGAQEALGDTGGAYIVVMTHDHETDYQIAKTALQRGGFAYLGVIGSDTKSVKFKKRLAAEGCDASRLTCPIGIDGIDGKHPREIAIAVAAELLTLGLTGSAIKNAGDNAECEGRDCATCGK